jgi:hypothetical protein
MRVSAVGECLLHFGTTYVQPAWTRMQVGCVSSCTQCADASRKHCIETFSSLVQIKSCCSITIQQDAPQTPLSPIHSPHPP